MSKITNRRLLCAGFGLAVVGLIADRFLFGPSGADAAPLELPGAAAASPIAPAPAPKPRPESPAAIVERQLRLTTENQSLSIESVRDAFEPAALFTEPVAAVAVEPEKQSEDEIAAGRFRARNLTAVFGHEGAWSIQVDGNTLVIGKSLDGFTLESVDRTGATFRRGEHVVRLELPGIGGNGKETLNVSSR